MKRNTILGTAQFLLIILGITMILIGASSDKFLLPPILTGIGFIIISWAFKSLKR